MAKKQTTNSSQPTTKSGSAAVSPIAAGVIIVVIAALLGGMLFIWYQSAYEIGESEGQAGRQLTTNNKQPTIYNASKSSGQAKQETTSATGGSASGGNNQQQTNTNSQIATAEGAKTLIEDAINQRNANGMLDVMASVVYYMEEATECCGKISKNEAAANFLDYSKGTSKFNFSENQQVVKQLRVNMADFFAESKYTGIGIGNDRKVAAYNINSTGKVDKLYIAIDHRLFDLE